MNTDVRGLTLAIALTLLVGSASAQQYAGAAPSQDLYQQIGITKNGDETQHADGKDGKGCCDPACCLPRWAHRTGFFAEYLLLRATEGEVAYAVGIDGDIANNQAAPNQVQVTPVQLVDEDYTNNFRVGGTLALSACNSIVVTYTNFQSDTSSGFSVDPANTGDVVIRSLVLNPATPNANADFLNTSANLGIDYHTADLDYRSILWADDLGALNYLIGARFAELNQDFWATYGGTGTQDTVVTDVEFDGGGLRFGLDGERHHACNGFLVYGRGLASFVAGEFRTAYQYGNDVDPVIANTSWKAGRVMSIVDLELGAGWQSRCGHFRVTAGYLVNFWFNAVTTDQWIRSVQNNNFVGQRDGMSYDCLIFDGLTARAEYRF